MGSISHYVYIGHLASACARADLDPSRFWIPYDVTHCLGMRSSLKYRKVTYKKSCRTKWRSAAQKHPLRIFFPAPHESRRWQERKHGLNKFLFMVALWTIFRAVAQQMRSLVSRTACDSVRARNSDDIQRKKKLCHGLLFTAADLGAPYYYVWHCDKIFAFSAEVKI